MIITHTDTQSLTAAEYLDWYSVIGCVLLGSAQWKVGCMWAGVRVLLRGGQVCILK